MEMKIMSKALTVLAECVDVRTGKRFKPGEVFDPAPSVVGARHLVAAGCLPEAAIDAAAAAEADAEKAAETKAKADQDARAKAEAEAKKAAERKA
jgi:colicin import membrane protein